MNKEKMNNTNLYQVSIIGGGLAGLTLAIQLADAGYTCVLFEKNRYPFHKVCGEYISMESWGFLERLGINLFELNLPKINQLHVSSPSGKLLKHQLDLGGFGISRYLLDSKLAQIASEKGDLLLDDCRVNDVKFDGSQFTINSAKGSYTSEVCVGAWGKKSNLDTKLNREFTKEAKSGKNYIGIKYHINIDFPNDLIELHNFQKAEFLFEEPLAISQIKIGFKNAVENHILMLGDTAGNIAPLNGNGMSMAMRSSFFMNQLLVDYFNGKYSRSELETTYEHFWMKQFKKRVAFSVFLQRLLKNTTMTNFAIMLLKAIPFLRNSIVKSTHGKPF